MKERKFENPYEILNHVLEQLADKTEDNPINDAHIMWHSNLLFDLSPRDRFIILKKLKKDGFIDSLEVNNDNNNPNAGQYHGWYITFEGILFLNDGAYLGREAKEKLHLDTLKAEQKMHKRNEKIIAYGSVLAASGAIGLLLWEILQVICSNVCCY